MEDGLNNSVDSTFFGVNICRKQVFFTSHRIHVCYIWYYMVTFTINIPPMLVYIPYMDPMGMCSPPFLGLP